MRRSWLSVCLIFVFSVFYLGNDAVSTNGVVTRSDVSLRPCLEAVGCKGSYEGSGYRENGGEANAEYSTTVNKEGFMTFTHVVGSKYSNEYGFKIDRTVEIDKNIQDGFSGSLWEFLELSDDEKNASGFFSGQKSETSTPNRKVKVDVSDGYTVCSNNQQSCGDADKYHVAYGEYTDGGSGSCVVCNRYAWRDFYKISFKEAGEYKFCETISITGGWADGTNTKSCVKVKVVDNSVPTPTPIIKPPEEHFKYTLFIVPVRYDGEKYYIMRSSSPKSEYIYKAEKDKDTELILNGDIETNQGFNSEGLKLEAKYGKKLSGLEFNNKGVNYKWKALAESNCILNLAACQNYTSITGNTFYFDKTKIIYAIFEADSSPPPPASLSFEGESIVKTDKSYTTGWKKGNAVGRVEISNCDPEDGCKAKFKHNLKRTAGEGSTSYTISRLSNLSTGDRGITSGTLETGTFFGTEETVYDREELTLYPGMVVCEAVSFHPEGGDKTSGYGATVTICASARGKAQPEDPSDNEGNKAFLYMDVKNDSNSKYNEYQKVVYAKPGDNVTYRATYNPILQYTYYLIPERLLIDENGYPKDSSKKNTTYQLYEIFDERVDPDWNNGFAVYSGNEGGYSSGFVYDRGNSKEREETNKYSIKSEDVGHELTETAETNTDIEANKDNKKETTKTTPSQVIFEDDNGINTGNVITDPIASTAHVYIPYNFVNAVTVEKTGNGDSLFAGDMASFMFKITTKKKENRKIGGDPYATVVKNVKATLKVCLEDDKGNQVGECKDYDFDDIGDINNDNDIYNEPETSRSKEVAVPDANAGMKICVRAGVYPNESDEEKWDNPEGKGGWSYSEEKCFDVAKRPSIQIWGGSMFTNGNITLNEAKKRYLAGYNEEGDGNYIFGSWTELGLIANGEVKGLASGAGLGYADNDNGTLWPSYSSNNNDLINWYKDNKNIQYPGGATSSGYCKMSTLSFANNDCGNSVGNLGSSSNPGRSSLIDTLEKDDVEQQFSATVSETPVSNEGKKTILIRNDDGKNITISGNIEYGDTYSSLNDIPKLFIYANDIKINCDVTRIDAVLIAEESIDTCPTDFSNTNPNEGINSPGNSNQLIINGTIIANKLLANRTYGAATGANSMIPAEIINYDSTLFLWGQARANGGDAGKLEVVYQTELAPRY